MSEMPDVSFERIALSFMLRRYEELFLVNADSGRCLDCGCGKTRKDAESRSYVEKLGILSAGMPERERNAFALKMELATVLEVLEENPFYFVHYRPEGNSGRLCRLIAGYYDKPKRILVMARSDETACRREFSEKDAEVSRDSRRFRFLLKNLCKAYLEVDVETGECLAIDTDTFEETRSAFREQVDRFAKHVIAPSQAEKFAKEFERDNLLRLLRRNNGFFAGRHTAKSENGERELLIVSVLMSGPFSDAKEYIFSYAQDITDLKRQEEKNRRLVDISQQLLDLSQADPLTALLNRAACEKLVMRHLGDSESGGGGTLLMIDVDNFKDFNDTYGHPAGDEVLKYLSGWMKAVFRNDDIVCRWGGDEFMVFMRNVVQLSGVRARIEVLREKANQFYLEGEQRPIQLSIGGSVAVPGDSFERLFAQADKALYSVKRHGRNGWALFGAESLGGVPFF